MSHSLVRYFDARHLTGPLREVSEYFTGVAEMLDDSLPEGAEKTVALRKLLESKDAAVRAALDLPALPTQIEELDLSIYAYNALKRAGIHTVEQITANPEAVVDALAATQTQEN